jgi:hypothetical protein
MNNHCVSNLEIIEFGIWNLLKAVKNQKHDVIQIGHIFYVRQRNILRIDNYILSQIQNLYVTFLYLKYFWVVILNRGECYQCIIWLYTLTLSSNNGNNKKCNNTIIMNSQYK